MTATLAHLLHARGTLNDATHTAATAPDGPPLHTLIDNPADELRITRALADLTGLPFTNLDDTDPDPAIAITLKEPLARTHLALPLTVDEHGTLHVAVVDPTNVFALDDIRNATGYEPTPTIAAPSQLLDAIAAAHSTDDGLQDLSDEMDDDVEEQDLAQLQAETEDAPIVKFVNSIIVKAVLDRASDIHIEPTEKHLAVRYRIDGVLHTIMHSPRTIHSGVISRLKIMADLDIAERRLPQDGRISLTVAGKPIDLRVSTLPTVYGQKLVLRILDSTSALLSLSDLGFLHDTFTKYEAAYRKPYGMILVTGPTGSGKSTTLYATLNILNRPEVNIVTTEDPVEYRLQGISQVQINPKVGLTFANALRSIFRQDPDIVLVGEARDKETAKIAIEAAHTGHLVLSSLHTNDAAAAVTRLTEMGIEPFLVASALDVVLAQRLARRLCTECKTPYQPDRNLLTQAGFEPHHLDEPPTLYRAAGCTRCSNTGYRGRLALHEILLVDEDIERLTVEQVSSDTIKHHATTHQQMRPLRQDGLEKALAGQTSVEEVSRVVT